ncbi:MAG: sterol desaturase family protein [Acidimicrobiales bacterium]|jgi:sterol desaturase/sphingolipid hydroxylase (fatty acid hydroxylase superfamily)
MKDLTVVAIPFYFGSMGAEYLFLRNKDEEALAHWSGRDISSGAYERQDTIASLTMGVGSLILPLAVPRLLRPVTPGRGKYGKALVLTAAGAAALTTLADQLARLESLPEGDNEDAATTESGVARSRAERRRKIGAVARQVASVGGVTAIVTGGVAFTTAWADRTTVKRLWKARVLPDLGKGPLALAGAIAGWDFIYYWNHRFMHECRALWAIHVVHHSSERYNLSTALRQPVADAFGAFIPYSLLALFGIRPDLINTARGVNLLYQFWIHTETVDSLGPAESALNTPSHHRVHHGSNGRYLDKNHGSILIVWDRLFGTFEREDEQVRYGLTKNIKTFNPVTIATHEHVEMLKDVARSTNWRDRLSFVLRGPGWAGQRKAKLIEEPTAVEAMA